MKRLIIIIALLSLHTSVFADEPCFLRIDKEKIAPGKQARLSLIVPGAADMPAPEMPFVKGLNIKYQRTEKQLVDLGGGSISAEICVYNIGAAKEGVYRIGPISFDHGGKRYTSDAVVLKVSREFIRTEEPRVSDENKTDLKDHIYLAIDTPGDKILINQKMPISVTLFSDWLDVEDIVIADIDNPDLVVEKFQKGSSSVVTRGGKRYAALEYRASLLAPGPGTFTIEPIKVSFNIARRKTLPSGEKPELLNDNESFYDRLLGPKYRASYELLTRPVILKVADLPRQGRPATFKGAIGSFNFDVTINPTSLKIGDPLTLKATVTGQGNYNTITGIDIPVIDGFKNFEPQISRTDSSFTQQQVLKLIGQTAGEIPAITFSFFDPAKGEYISISRGPFPLAIEPIKKWAVSAQGAAIVPLTKEKKPAPEDVVAIKKYPGTFSLTGQFSRSNKIYMPALLFPVILLFCSILIKRRIDFLHQDIEYANWLRAIKKSDEYLAILEKLSRTASPKVFYDAVFFKLREYLSLRLLTPAGGITEKTVDDILGSKPGYGDIIATIRSILSDCHVARFTSTEMQRNDMARTFEETKKVMSYFNRRTYVIHI